MIEIIPPKPEDDTLTKLSQDMHRAVMLDPMSDELTSSWIVRLDALRALLEGQQKENADIASQMETHLLDIVNAQANVIDVFVGGLVDELDDSAVTTQATFTPEDLLQAMEALNGCVNKYQAYQQGLVAAGESDFGIQVSLEPPTI